MHLELEWMMMMVQIMDVSCGLLKVRRATYTSLSTALEFMS